MRTVDERVAEVRGRAARMRRRRSRAMAGAASVLPALVVVFLVGIPMANGQFADVPDNSSPFGASSLFGPSAGGYVLVAVLAAAVAVAVTVTLMMRRKSSNKRVNDAAEPIMGADKKGGE